MYTLQSKLFAGLMVLGLSLFAMANQANAAPTLAVGGQARAKAGSSVGVVRVRIVYNGKSFMMNPVKVQKGGSPVMVKRVVDKVVFYATVHWPAGASVRLRATAKTPKGVFNAYNTIQMKSY